MKKHSIQVIGTYLEDLINYLSDQGIVVENVINKINPITLGYEFDESKQIYCDEKMDACSILDIKKNFSAVLSRDADEFCSNLPILGFYAFSDVDMRKKNTSDYIVIYNNYVNCPLLLDNGILYTNRYPYSKFAQELGRKEGVLREFTFLKEINWKQYFDNFIETILKEYTPDKIILVRNSVGPWYVDKDGIKMFDKDFSEYRQLSEEMDQYFFEKTNCICLDDFFASVSDRNPKCIAPASMRSRECLIGIADRIIEIIKLQDEGKDVRSIFSPARNTMVREESLAEYYFKVEKTRRFSAEDFMYVERYVLEQECDIQDVITIYFLQQKYAGIYCFGNILNNILSRQTILQDMEIRFYEKNRQYIEKYPYVSKPLVESNTKNHYFRLPHNLCLKLSTEDSKLELLQGEKKSFKDVKEKRMVCSVKDMEHICGDLSFYISRAREGYGNEPLRVCFQDDREFTESMHFVNYIRVLENEPFLLEVKEGHIENKEYTVRTDLSFLFEDKVRICFITNGLADQIRHYLFSKMVTDDEMKVYYDDIRHMRLRIRTTDISKVLIEDIEKRRFSNIFSEMLIENNFSNVLEAADVLYQAGLTELMAVSFNEQHYGQGGTDLYRGIKECPKILFCGKDITRIKEVSSRVQYLAGLPHFAYIEEQYKRYIRFPDFDLREDIIVAEKMLSCDAVVLQVRRGDYLTLIHNIDTQFYRESMEKLIGIPDYPNKKIFVFSDDIEWCKDHWKELGLSMFEVTNICYVDHNIHENVYRDMQLMMLGKIFICAGTGISRVAAGLSDRLEMYMSYHLPDVEEREQNGYRNKYEVGAYSKKYGMDYK